MSDETRTLIREQWDRSVRLYRKYTERALWIADHLDEPDWKDLEENVHRLASKLADALEVVYLTLGRVNAGGLWARLEACGEVKFNA